MRDTHHLQHRLEQIVFPSVRRRRLETLQVNVGYRCNQSCIHCHVNAGPRRKEEMSAAVADEVLAFLARNPIATLDITGGAPELNPQFRRMVVAARQMQIKVMDRCNLTILEVPGQEDLAGFLANSQVEIVASMPCYLESNVDRQRGRGVFESSIRGLKKLNALNYAHAADDLRYFGGGKLRFRKAKPIQGASGTERTFNEACPVRAQEIGDLRGGCLRSKAHKCK